MTIPALVTTELNSLKAQVLAAEPLANASHATVVALQLNGQQLVADVQAALVALTLLDTWTAPVDAISMITGVLSVAETANDQNTLSLMRGVVGRAASNLDQL